MGQGISTSGGNQIRRDRNVNDQHQQQHQQQNEIPWSNFRDLKELPPEIAISILSNLNATDLCLASCVWKDLAEDDMLWKGLCTTKWSYTSLYNRLSKKSSCSSRFGKKPVYKTLYLLLDEATLIFAFRPPQGIKYLVDHEILQDNATELAKFFDGTSALYPNSIQVYMQDRHDVLDEFIKMQTFTDLSICDGLRKFFKKLPPPEQRGEFLDLLVEKFSSKFYECNPNCGFNRDHIAVLCYSLLLLSVDLYSPHVKNKMSKREFIRNNRQVLMDANRDMLGDIYDDVYLNGHIVPHNKQIGTTKKKHRFPFYRPYGAIFEFKPIELKLNCSC
ncbi:F-box only protein 8-like [Hydractinia symbiolongicarpus]|uniref:F-box only protein 8-like n=1 Tax=Hydractinia symbiolongicarpus TaxID=13093 RepID=UPI0025515BDD|nr:F-box only protein 8-like [Hydractinia symbiolongicarpus]